MRLTDLPFQTMSSQPAFEPAALERFVAAPRIGVLAYVKRDGTPAQVPIWYQYRDGRFHVVTAKTSPKAKAVARTRRASLTIQDEMPPYRAVIVEADVRLEDTPVEGGVNSWLAMHYLGRVAGREFEKMTADENHRTGLSLVTLDPTRVRGFDNTRSIGLPLRLFMRLREALPLPRSWF
jgi:nitroimidazol reductase NimA-like FMN-containing flavoprotein (pyridoxamine 5'-phosphate oxidase superfamily)